MTEFVKIINDAWDNKDQVNQNSDKKLKDTINQIIEDLDSGKSRVAEKINGEWITHQHIKKAIMLSFRIHGMETLSGPYSAWHDKAHLLKGKTAGWGKEDFEKAAELRDRIKAMSAIQSKQDINLEGIGDADVIAPDHQDVGFLPVVHDRGAPGGGWCLAVSGRNGCRGRR